MQRADTISLHQLNEIVDAIFCQGPVVVKQTYSDYGCPTLEFETADALMKNMPNGPIQDKAFFYYALYYPEAKGFVYEERIKLIPEKCHGHKFRFSQNGWGLISLQCTFRPPLDIECKVAVNTRNRALKWYQTYPEYKNPELWDWKIIEKKAGKLVRLLSKLRTASRQGE